MKKEITNGSENQIKWANDIRDGILNGLYAMKQEGFSVDYTIERLENCTNAKWWINKETGLGFKDVLPEIEYEQQGIAGKNDIAGFYYRESRNSYVALVNSRDVVLFRNIKNLKEKIKEEK